MNALRERLLAEALEWEGTPHHPQQLAKGIGCDCRLVIGIARGIGRPEADCVEASLVQDHHGRVPVGQMRQALVRLFDKVPIAEPADILLMRVGGKPQHLAMYMGEGRMIHCYARGPGRVIVVPMGHAWWSQVDSIWSWRQP